MKHQSRNGTRSRRVPRDAVDKWIDNDFSAIDEIRQGLYGFVYSLSKDHNMTEEVVQMTLVTLCEGGLERFHRGADADPWLRKIALNNFRNLYNKKKRIILSLETPLALGSETTYKDTLIDNSTPIGEYECEAYISERDELLSFIAGEIRKGSKAYEAFALRHIQGLSYEEIRTYLNVPEGTVKSRISTAKRDLIDSFQS